MKSILLCGGKSSRMGKDKARLKFAPNAGYGGGAGFGAQGATDFAAPDFREKIGKSLALSGEVFFAGAEEDGAYAGRGPLAGIRAGALHFSEEAGASENAAKDCGAGAFGSGAVGEAAARAEELGPGAGAPDEWLFVCACDLPFMDASFSERLISHAAPGDRAVVAKTPDGRLHPLAALYRKDAALGAAEELLSEGEGRASALAKRLNFRIVDIADIRGRKQLTNINTPEEYGRLSELFAPLIGVSGPSGSGKTTLIEKLCERFRSEGLRLAYLKHTHHEIDHTPGKDSSRLAAGGAHISAVLSDSESLFILRGKSDVRALAERIRTEDMADLILIEGYKAEDIAYRLVLDDLGRVRGSFGGKETEAGRGETLWSRDDDKAIAAAIFDLFGRF